MISLLLFFIPFLSGIASSVTHSPLLGLLSVISIFGTTALNPVCRKREVLWIFLLTSLSTIPLNVSFLLYFYRLPHFYTPFRLFVFSVGFLMRYLLLLNMEEIIFCWIGYKIWGPG